VVGVAYGISRTAWGDSLFSGAGPGEGHEMPEGFTPPEGFEGGKFDPDALAGMPERGDRPDFEGGGPGGGFNLTQTLDNLAVVGVISLLVIGVSWLSGRVKRLRRSRAAPEGAA
jgi:hypothetical protein